MAAGRQIVHDSTLACDVRRRARNPPGWDAASNADLERFCAEILGENLVVTETGATEA